MSWNLLKYKFALKAQLTSRYTAIADRVPYIADQLESTMRMHFDTATAAGQIIANPGVVKGMKAYLVGEVLANYKNTALNKIQHAKQIAHAAQMYWIGRQIDGPIGTTIILFPGIWTSPDLIHNLIPNAKQWVDRVAISMYLQKLSLLGITLSKAVPGLVTPWTGAFLQGLDNPLGLSGLLTPVLNSYSKYIDLLMTQVKGNLDLANKMKAAFEAKMKSFFTQELFDQVASIPNVYGFDFSQVVNP